MDQYFFHYPHNKDKYDKIQHLLSFNRSDLLKFFNITEDLFTFLTLTKKPTKTLKSLFSQIKTENIYEKLIYNKHPTTHNIYSTFFLQLVKRKPKATYEDKIVYYLYTKDYENANICLNKIKNHTSFMYLTFCKNIKLKQHAIINALENINTELFLYAYNIIKDKDLVSAIALIRCNVKLRLDYFSKTLYNIKECRFIVTKILQKKYYYNGDMMLYEKSKECLNFMGLAESEEYICSWLRIFYIKNENIFNKMMYEYKNLFTGKEYIFLNDLLNKKNGVEYEGIDTNMYAALDIKVCSRKEKDIKI